MTSQLITGSIVQAFLICPRQAWLISRAMTGDQDHDYLKIGSLIEEKSFEREKKRIYVPQIGAVIDMIQKKGGKYKIIEIKKSSKMLKSGKVQLKYYLYLLKKKNIEADGLIKIPKERISESVELTESDISEMEKMISDINKVLETEKPPKAKYMRKCKTCSYSEFCWA